MSRYITAFARARSLFVVFGLAACSPQVPKESEVFLKKSAAGGTAGVDTGGNGGGGADNGGTGGADNGGTGGTDNGGTGADNGGTGGTKTVGKSGSTGNATGSGGQAGGTSGGATGAGGTDATGGTTFNPLNEGLVAHYPFNEESGTIANNVVDPAKSGTYVGTVAHPSGSAKYGKSASLRNYGSTDYIELPAGLLSGLSATTISIWFKVYSDVRTTSLFVVGEGAKENQIYFIPCVTKTVGNYQLAGTHDGSPFLSYVSTEGTALISTGWHQAAIAWDSAALTFYIDGVAKATVESPAALPSDMDVTTPTWIGRDEDGSLYVEVDDFRIYNRALSQESITALYTATW